MTAAYRRLAAITLFVIGFSLAFTAGVAFGNPADSENVSVARLYVHPMASADGSESCSYVMVAPQTAVTAAHCVDGVEMVVNGRPVKVVRINKETDLALIAVNRGCPCAPMFFGALPVDTPVAVIGYPFYGLGAGLYKVQIVTYGTVQGYLADGSVAASVLVAPGNSGGGLFVRMSNGKWYLAGIASKLVSTMPGPSHLSIFASPRQIDDLTK